MGVNEILELLPDSVLEKLAIETEVNHYSKKLQGQIVFKLLIYCILSHKDNSLRTMESAYESIGFNLLNQGSEGKKVRYNSISERLSKIKPAYFESLYKSCVTTYSKRLKAADIGITRFDSTIVTESGKLLSSGYHLKGGDADHVRQLKFTIGYSDIPIVAKFFTEQKYTSENTALKEAILSAQPDKDNGIQVFDKGITSRNTYDEFIERRIPFVSRVGEKCKSKECLPNSLGSPIDTPTLTIVSDSWQYLFSSKRSKHPVRIIRAIIKSTGMPIAFVTSIADLDTETITCIYKRRWDIEVFFKFLKQHLNFSHLINRSENGIKVIFYVTMIAAILVLVYKKENGLTGYKIMKQRFVQNLETELVKEFVILCGGNPDLVDKIMGRVT